MSILYYPKGSIIYRRDTLSGSYEQLELSTSPNTIIYFDTSSNLNYISSSTIYHTSSNSLYSNTSSNVNMISASGAWKIYVNMISGSLSFIYS